eukprot:758610-Hanusia_phi.AAC.2
MCEESSQTAILMEHFSVVEREQEVQNSRPVAEGGGRLEERLERMEEVGTQREQEEQEGREEEESMVEMDVKPEESNEVKDLLGEDVHQKATTGTEAGAGEREGAGAGEGEAGRGAAENSPLEDGSIHDRSSSSAIEEFDLTPPKSSDDSCMWTPLRGCEETSSCDLQEKFEEAAPDPPKKQEEEEEEERDQGQDEEGDHHDEDVEIEEDQVQYGEDRGPEDWSVVEDLSSWQQMATVAVQVRSNEQAIQEGMSSRAPDVSLPHSEVSQGRKKKAPVSQEQGVQVEAVRALSSELRDLLQTEAVSSAGSWPRGGDSLSEGELKVVASSSSELETSRVDESALEDVASSRSETSDEWEEAMSELSEGEIVQETLTLDRRTRMRMSVRSSGELSEGELLLF